MLRENFKWKQYPHPTFNIPSNFVFKRRSTKTIGSNLRHHRHEGICPSTNLDVFISAVTKMEYKQGLSLTSRFITLVIFLVVFNCITSDAVPPGSVIMKIVNNAGAPIELFWINVFEKDRPLLKQTSKPIRNNTDNVVRTKILI